MFASICDLIQLHAAFKRAQQDNHYKHKVCSFTFHLEQNLCRLSWELRHNQYSPQPYEYFVVREPKTRDIAAPAFRDRVVHHSLVAQIQPLFEKQFIYDAYACRVDKGTHFGAKRLKKFLMSARSIHGSQTPLYVLQCDISKFFQSIAWDQLIALTHATITCPQTRDLIEKIVHTHVQNQPLQSNHPARQNCYPTFPSYLPPSQANYVPQPAKHPPLNPQLSLFDPPPPAAIPGISLKRRVGLPIGNLTSQLFANIYLNQLDHYIKDRLRLRWYGRYMDDFYILHPDPQYLQTLTQDINAFLHTQLGLSIHPKKLTITNVRHGVPFVGYRVFYDHILIRGKTLLRMERHWRKKQKLAQKQLITSTELAQTKAAMLGHLTHADTYYLRQHLFAATSHK